MIIVKGGVTAAGGFVANGVKAGIKKSGKRDLALIASALPAVAAGAFTTNRFRASPVRVSIDHLRNRSHYAIIMNSGNANCANGRRGDRDARRMTEYAASALGLKSREVLVASTGIIGHPLPVEKIRAQMDALVGGLSPLGGELFAEAIMTTDTVPKEYAVKVKIGGAVVTIGGAAKGVGMIHPVMQTERHATMLAFLTTDAAISRRMLERALDAAVGRSFNRVSVDGDMSTNDSCFILANGSAGNRPITAPGAAYRAFADALTHLAGELARMLARDGEGATKFIEIEVTGARTEDEAVAVARKISTSNLFKCCIFGADPNWGRVAAAAGSAGVAFDPDRVDIYLGGTKVLANGGSVPYNEKRVHRLFLGREIAVKVDLKAGRGRTKVWTCDFSKEYVEINSAYST